MRKQLPGADPAKVASADAMRHPASMQTVIELRSHLDRLPGLTQDQGFSA